MLEQAIPTAEGVSNEKPTVIMARDVANNISKLKHMNVSATLHTRFKAEPKVLMPREAGLLEWNRMVPTIDIVFYVMESGSSSEIREALKAQLYVPAKNAKRDMFRLSTHGLLKAEGATV